MAAAAGPPSERGPSDVWTLVVDAGAPASEDTPAGEASFVGAGRTTVGGGTAASLVQVVDGLTADVRIVVLTDDVGLAAFGGDLVPVLVADVDTGADAAARGQPVTDALKRVAPDATGTDLLVEAVPREGLVEAAWPQAFDRTVLRAAAADGVDASGVMAFLVDAGHRVRVRVVAAPVRTGAPR